MLGEAKAITMIPVQDIKRARHFYEMILGLKVVAEDLSGPQNPGILFQAGGESQVYLFRRESSNADHTLISFLVEDIEREVKELRVKGITFEKYDTPQLRTIDGIARFGKLKGAWFKDSEGNNIEIAQLTG